MCRVRCTDVSRTPDSLSPVSGSGWDDCFKDIFNARHLAFKKMWVDDLYKGLFIINGDCTPYLRPRVHTHGAIFAVNCFSPEPLILKTSNATKANTVKILSLCVSPDTPSPHFLHYTIHYNIQDPTVPSVLQTVPIAQPQIQKNKLGFSSTDVLR